MSGLVGILWIVAVVFVVLWILGLLFASTAGWVIHLLLVAAVIVIIYNLLTGKRAV